jgi:hypothetical protein
MCNILIKKRKSALNLRILNLELKRTLQNRRKEKGSRHMTDANRCGEPNLLG